MKTTKPTSPISAAKYVFRASRLICVCIAFAACKKDKPQPTPVDTNFVQHGKGVFIGNEGQYLHGNASLMYYRFGDENPSADLYQQANAQPLGDVLQSLLLDGDRLYAVLNNSHKIEAVQMPSFANVNTVVDLTSPRYMVKVSDDVAFVTNYGSSLYKVSLSQHAVTDSMHMPDWTEALLYRNGKLYVTTVNTEKLYACDPASMQIVDSAAVGIGGNGLVVDKNGMLWVFCAGNAWSVPAVPAALVKLDPNAMQVLTSFDLGLNGPLGRLCGNAAGDTLYFLNGDVYRMSIDDNAVPPPFIAAAGRSLYGLYRHPSRSELYVTDAKDYTQNGDVSVYALNGTLKKTITAGPLPSIVLAY